MRPTLVSLGDLGPEAPPAESPRLRWVGPFSGRIGTPLHAFSEVLEGGWNAASTAGSEPSLLRLWLGAVSRAIAIAVGLGVIVLALGLGIATLNHTETGPVVAGAIGLALLTSLALALAFRPEQAGITAIVGTEGIEMGEVHRGELSRVVSRFDETDVVWLERRRQAEARPGARVEGLIELRRRSDLAPGPCLEASWAEGAGASAASSARARILAALAEHGHPRRIEAARARMERGEVVVLPALDGRSVRLSKGTPVLVERVDRDGSVARVEEVALADGVYTLRIGGGSEALPRHTLGDALLLDALVLVPRGVVPSIVEPPRGR